MKFGHCAQPGEFAAVKRSGYAFTELRGKAVAAMSDEAFDQVCRELELPCLGFNAYCPAEVVIAGPGYDRANTRAYAARLAARAGRLGIRQVGIGSPASRTLPEGYDRKKAKAQLREFLMDTAECFDPVGVKVALEPHKVGLILDFLNMELSGEDERELLTLVPSVLHTHISDYDGTPYRRDELKPAYYERHRERLRRLKAAGYDGSVSIETDLPYDEERAQQTLLAIRDIG